MHPNDHLKLMFGDFAMTVATLQSRVAELETEITALKEAKPMPNTAHIAGVDEAAAARVKSAQDGVQKANFAALKRLRDERAVTDADWATHTADPAFAAWLAKQAG